MSTETEAKAPKKLTITLTDRPPVKIIEDDWPIVAQGKWKDWDNTYECQANRTWLAWLKVRQHEDGRTIIYGCYDYSSCFQGESGSTHRNGVMLIPSAEEYPESARDSYWTGPRIVEAIREVGGRLAERSQCEHWPDVIAETIADMPAEELA